MAARKLVTRVHVDGVSYGPDDEVPADVAAKITNPKAWADPKAADADAKAADAKPAAKATGSRSAKG